MHELGGSRAGGLEEFQQLDNRVPRAAMLATLEQQGEIRRISRFLTGPGLRWGTKPGDLPGVINDVGFVSSDAGTLSIAVLTENLPGLDAAERAIGLISSEALALTGIVPFAPDPSVSP
ncbi:MAG: serine hydrolase [Acidimicrobiia bacterium]